MNIFRDEIGVEDTHEWLEENAKMRLKFIKASGHPT
jgi:hypothetical protein